MPDTVNGLLPLLVESQEQKWSTINDGMERISSLLGAGAVDRLSAPPGSPADGSVYLIGAGASGDWAGHSNELGLFINGGWVFFTPGTDFTIWVADEDRFYKFAAGAWSEALLALAYDDYTLASALGILPGSVGAPGLYINGDTNTGLYQPAGADSLGVTIGGTRKAQFDAEGLILGDDGPSADVTLGLVINQGAADDGALALKSSDVAHAMTALAEADTWFLARKVDGADGGASLEAYSEGSFALRFRGVPTAAPAFNSSFSFGAVMFDAIESDGGTGTQAIGAGDVIAAFRNEFDARAAILGNGDFWIDGQMLPDDGAVGAPVYSFQSDRDTGFYLIGSGQMGVAVGGMLRTQFTSDGYLIHGDGAGAGGLVFRSGATPLFQINSTGGAQMGQSRWSNGAGGPVLYFIHSRSGTVGTPGVALQSGDQLLRIAMNGDDGSDTLTTAAELQVLVDGSVSGNTIPSRIDLWTAAGLSADDQSKKWSLRGNGNVEQTQGILFVGDTANANMTLGLTINEGSANAEVIALKSSNVAHGYTTYSETDTWLTIKRQSNGQGGASITSLCEDAASTTVLAWRAFGGTADTAKSTSANGLINFFAGEHDGANAAANMAAGGNAFAVRKVDLSSGNNTLFIIDNEGDLHVDGSGSLATFDAYDDVAMVEAWDQLRSPAQTVKDDFAAWALSEVGERTLIEAGILGDTIVNGGLVNVTQLQRLHNGAIRQLARELRSRDSLIQSLTARLDAIEAGPHLN